MINGKKISVCLVVYRRLTTIADIVNAWWHHTVDDVDEVFLCDCTDTGLPPTVRQRIDPRTVIIRFSKDLGNRTRHAMALLTKGDIVIQSDDDLMPRRRLAKTLVNAQEKLGGMVGLIGRVFNGPHYKQDTTFYAARAVKEPTRVSFIGVTYCCAREDLVFDMRGMENPINDLFWCLEGRPDTPKWVSPIHERLYTNLSTCNDADCLFHNKEAERFRQAYYQKHWERGVLHPERDPEDERMLYASLTGDYER